MTALWNRFKANQPKPVGERLELIEKQIAAIKDYMDQVQTYLEAQTALNTRNAVAIATLQGAGTTLPPADATGLDSALAAATAQTVALEALAATAAPVAAPVEAAPAS